LIIHELYRLIFSGFRRSLPLWLKCRPSGEMKIVKAKRILTGLPDDRKNLSCPQGPRGKKNATGCFIIRSAVSLEMPDNNHSAPAHFPKGVPL